MAVPLQPLTLGIEEEYQIIDPVTRDLRTYISELLTQDQNRHKKLDLKPELMQSQVEVGSHVCRNIKEARSEITGLRRDVLELADENGLMIAAASTHPFARWEDQIITEGTRYKELLDDMQGVARQLLIFGMHVHVGFGDDPESRELLIATMNQARYFIPHLLALSTSSPFWRGQNTGLKSYRSVVFESLPRTGIPHSFMSWADYKDYEIMLERVGAFGKLDKRAKIWWDIRPHPIYPTLEFRISDICTNVNDCICIAALFQAICAKLLKLRRQNMSWRQYRHVHITENKWRAVRYGIDGELIDFGIQQSVPFYILAAELLEFLDDVVDELDSREEVGHVLTILSEGTSADRQLRVYREHGGDENQDEALRAVVDYLVAETKRGII
ncbi:Carboxylate-amine ligase Haur_4831 [Candidatus Promineifilum breve]|uniref:Putative glutamate--cysteine ligase 2 n=1 Tax=Candidatus Promineifilum breve TaxID=1806508 RepID=A0A160T6F8_9CHLR|nr:carboxylate-amine ligase [Candidatus Promineifilum breve]CUS05472.2 Carboxylate-amine ligase Haur_4831 [Candidatus Promineifilum breve]